MSGFGEAKLMGKIALNRKRRSCNQENNVFEIKGKKWKQKALSLNRNRINYLKMKLIKNGKKKHVYSIGKTNKNAKIRVNIEQDKKLPLIS